MKMKKQKSRIISLLLACMMVLSVISSPTSAFADELATDTNATEITTEESNKEATTESISEEQKEEVTTEEQASEETTEEVSEEKDPEEIDASDLPYRLFVASDDEAIFTDGYIISSYEGMYLVGYKTLEERNAGFIYYQSNAIFVELDDEIFEIADTDSANEDTAEPEVINQDDALTVLGELEESEVIDDNKVIAVIDTGANDKVADAVSVIGEKTADDNGHGTDMINTIISENPNAKILSIKAFDENGKAKPSDIYAAVRYAIDNKVSIINMSFSAFNTENNSIIKDIINEAIDNNIIVVGAAGNNSKDVKYYIPGNVENAIIAGSVDKDANKKDFSNYGDTVDYYVISESTSEAAAILSGIISKDGKNFKNDLVVLPSKVNFNTIEDKKDNESLPETKNGIFKVQQYDGNGAGQAYLTYIGDRYVTWGSDTYNVSGGWSKDTRKFILCDDNDYAGESWNAYCVDPEYSKPNKGIFKVYEVQDYIGHVMYYMYGAPGWDTPLSILGNKSWHQYVNENLGSSEDAYVTACHYLLATVAFTQGLGGAGYDGRPETGHPTPSWIVDKAVPMVQQAPSAPKGFHCYFVFSYEKNHEWQNVWGWKMSPPPYMVTLEKKSTIAADTRSMDGIKYGLYNAENKLIATYTLGANGKTKAIDIYKGTGSIAGSDDSVVTENGTLWLEWWSSLSSQNWYFKELNTNSNYAVKSNVSVPSGNWTSDVAKYNVTVKQGENTTGKASDAPVYGKIEVFKYADNNKNKPLSGAEFTVYSDSNCTQVVGKMAHNDGNGRHEYTSAKGFATLTGLTPGTYYVKETKAPTGYKTNNTIYTVNINAPNGQVSWGDVYMGYVFDPVYYFNNTLSATDKSNLHLTSTLSSNLSAEDINTMFRHYICSGLTNEVGSRLGNPSFRADQYLANRPDLVTAWASETNKANYNNSINVFAAVHYARHGAREGTMGRNEAYYAGLNAGVNNNGQISVTLLVSDESQNAYVALKKSSSNINCTNNNPNYVLTSTQYKIFKSEAEATAAKSSKDYSKAIGTFTVKADGTSNVIDVTSYMNKSGSSITNTNFWVFETVAGTGYKLDNTIHTVTVTPSNDSLENAKVLSVTDEPINDPSSIRIYKNVDGSTYPLGDTVTRDLEYTVTQYYTKNDAINGTNAVRHWVYTPTIINNNTYIYLRDTSKIINSKSDALYDGSNTGMVFPLGWYTIKETNVSNAKGLKFSNNTFYMEVYDGGATNPINGEKRASARMYKNNTTNVVTPTQATDTVDYYGLDNDATYTGKLRVVKKDNETNGSSTQGRNSFSGINYAVVNRSKVDNTERSVVYPAGSTVDADHTYAYGEVVCILTTNANGNTSYTDNLEYGTYDIYELRKDATINVHDVYDSSSAKLGNSKYANSYYLYCDDVVSKIINKDNPTYTVEYQTEAIHTDGENTTKEFKNAPIRSDVKWEKFDIDDNRLGYIPFLVSLVDSEDQVVEQHVILADSNGVVNTSTRSKTASTVNALDNYNDGNGNYTGPLNDSAAATNIWFGNIEDYTDTSVISSKRGSLLKGKYIIQELRCSNNKMHELVTGTVTIVEDGLVYDTDNEWIDILINMTSDAKDVNTNGKVITMSTSTSIKDDVHITHLKAGKSYKLVTEAFNIKQDGTVSSISNTTKEFVSTAGDDIKTAYMDVTNSFTVDATKLEAGSSIDLVDYLYLYDENSSAEDKWVLVSEHNTEFDDTNQRVVVPGFSSEASNVTINSRIGSLDPTTNVVDTFTYYGLGNNATYILNIKLVDDSNVVINDINGKACEYSTILYVNNSVTEVTNTGGMVTCPSNGTLSFTNMGLDAWEVTKPENSNGLNVVATIETANNHKQILSHNEDISIADESIQYMIIGTTASSSSGVQGLLPCNSEATLVDKISYDNCIDDIQIIVEGTVVEKETQEVVTTNSKTYDITAGSGEIELSFTFDTTKYEEKKLVVFESIYTMVGDKKVLISEHKDINDTAQTVRVPKIRTNATSSHEGTDFKVVTNRDFADITIVDKVTYTNVKPGISYDVTGVLKDKVTGKTVIDAEGKEVTNTVTFIPEKENGVVEVPFTFKQVLNKLEWDIDEGYVVFEGIRPSKDSLDFDYAVHADLEDKDQTVRLPKFRTVAANTNTEGNKNILPIPDQTITDQIILRNFGEATNVTEGDLFTLKAEAMNAETGEPILNNNEPVTAVRQFRYTGQTTESIDITFDATGLDGVKIVLFETLYYGDSTNEVDQVFREAVLDNEPQSVYVPTGKTVALDSKTKAHLSSVVTEEVQFVDTIYYENLAPNLEYEATGVLYSAKTGEPYEVDGKTYTNTVKFTPETPNGKVEVPITFNNANLAGETVVVFEDVTYNGYTVFMHHDLDDKDQTVFIPGGRTTALGTNANDHIINAAKDTKFTDTIHYTNLIPGNTYSATAELMVKDPKNKDDKGTALLDSTGKPITKTIEFEVTGNTDKVDGDITIDFTIDTTELKGKTIVVFEHMYYNGVEIFTHADITDEDQSIKIPGGKTTAIGDDSKTHEILAAKDVKFTDIITYTNLIVGKKYKATGKLYKAVEKDGKKTAEPLLDKDGKQYTKTVEFTAETSDGTIEVPFTVDSTKLVGQPIVVFEDVSYNNVTIFTHADVNDTEQTVTPKELKLHVKIAKADKDNVKYYLKGAEITIFNKDGSIAKDVNGKDCVGVTDENGLVEFTVPYVEDVNSYYAQETKAPNNYQLNSDKFEFKNTNDKEDWDTDLVKINILDSTISIPPTPKTGDIVLITLVSILVLSGLIVIFTRKKRDNK